MKLATEASTRKSDDGKVEKGATCAQKQTTVKMQQVRE
jgi:hypothetical protein